MADAQPNSGGPTVELSGIAKKKKAKVPRKPRAECTPEEIAKLHVVSVKRRNRRAVVKDNAAARKFAAERDAMEAVRCKAEVEEKEATSTKRTPSSCLAFVVRPVSLKWSSARGA
ncbi:putative DBINO protein [Hordeum vulgare]|nr:putative DBINO protein [Hordeum vulgare]